MALHSGLSMTEQMEVFEPSPPDSRKVIVATNIAEVSPHLLPHPNLKFPLPQASITIERVKFVVDCGFVKVGCTLPSDVIPLTVSVKGPHVRRFRRAVVVKSRSHF